MLDMSSGQTCQVIDTFNPFFYHNLMQSYKMNGLLVSSSFIKVSSHVENRRRIFLGGSKKKKYLSRSQYWQSNTHDVQLLRVP